MHLGLKAIQATLSTYPIGWAFAAPKRCGQAIRRNTPRTG